ncbi:MAG: MFS transporter [Ruminococcaceae bacterium]|nr:MFS transporter [Oscillospiraceae bacterium]
MLTWLKKHYYWIILIVMMLQTTIYGGMGNTIASIYTIPVTTDLGMSRTDFSLAVNMRPLILFLGMTFSGPVFQRFGVKKPMIFGLLTLTVGYVLLSVSNSFSWIAVSCALAGLGEAFVGTPAISRVVNTWFHRYQGSLLGLVTACTGLGGGIYSVLLSAIIQTDGWRTARFVSAICLLAAAVCIMFFLKDTPAQLQLLPYGKGYVPKKKAHRRSDEHWEGYSFKELLRKPVFYLAALTFFLAGVSIYSAFTTIAPHLEDKGLSAADAAFINGLMLIFLAVFKFACGSVSDIIGSKLVCIICMAAAAVSLLLLPMVNSVATAIPVIAIYSLSVPLTLVVLSLVTYPLFGYRSHDASLGIFLALPYAGSLLIVPITNAIYDAQGSYDLVFRLSAALSVVVIILLLIVYALAKRDRKKYEIQQNSKGE